MSATSPWQDPEFAAHYAKDAADMHKGWYEREVNLPSILRLIPYWAERILDFGCGPGEVTAQLAEQFTEVEGCDNSSAMLDIARRHRRVNYFEWDSEGLLPEGHEPYDVIISKLVVPFIERLDVFAASMHRTLNESGVLILSVPHPSYSAHQVKDYWEEVKYRQQISQFGIYDTPIHRSFERYMAVFMRNGFVLSGAAEPQAPEEVVLAHGEELQRFMGPKRLNLRFQKA
jgi:2-polyprenyl-3-methyl-5-hydroxy-6-metoxy-1,4-benzoquinol methylase